MEITWSILEREYFQGEYNAGEMKWLQYYKI